MENSEEFIETMQKILTQRIPGYLKNEFANLTKIVINENNIDDILESLEDLIYYLIRAKTYKYNSE